MTDNKNNINVIGGKLWASLPIASPENPLSIWFTPEYSGVLSEKGLEDVIDKINLIISYHPFNPSGNLKPLVGKDIGSKPSVVGKDLRFDISSAEIAKFTGKNPHGTLHIEVKALDNKNIDEINMEVRPLKEILLNQSFKASEALQVMSEKNDVNVNILKSTFNKNALPILFKIIEDGAQRLSFEKYNEYVNKIFCNDPKDDKPFSTFDKRRFLPFNDTDSYRVLKIATEAFLMVNAGVCCDLKDIDSEESLIKYFAKLDIRFATGDDDQFKTVWENYLKKEGSILPFLFLIRQKFGDVNITSNWIDELIENELCKCETTPSAQIDPSVQTDPNDQNSQAVENNMKEQCFGIVRQRLECPLFVELIWSYWQEEGMLVQGMNAITSRFQNMRMPGGNDPLAEMEISHLRPLNNLLWGYIQDEQHRLNVVRRAYEYDHHYGITLKGKAVPALNSADSRARFIEGFHGLLNLTSKYYSDSANKLVDADTYPLLNALREVHFTIAEGMHNQYGDLPSTARIEMLMQQWILARPEFRQFLPGRAAIPFTESWMDRVASMNKLQGWTDASPIHYDYLAKFGEQILLSIRFGDWSDQTRTSEDAALWANYFRSQIQGYIHSYKTVTGVDLAITLVGQQKIDSHQPSYHLAKRLKIKQNGKMTRTSKNGTPVKKNVQKEW